MKSAKSNVLDLLQHLPDDASYDDIQYHIYVRQKIEQGMDDVEHGRTLSQEEVERRMAKWIKSPSNGRT